MNYNIFMCAALLFVSSVACTTVNRRPAPFESFPSNNYVTVLGKNKNPTLVPKTSNSVSPRQEELGRVEAFYCRPEYRLGDDVERWKILERGFIKYSEMAYYSHDLYNKAANKNIIRAGYFGAVFVPDFNSFGVAGLNLGGGIRLFTNYSREGHYFIVTVDNLKIDVRYLVDESAISRLRGLFEGVARTSGGANTTQHNTTQHNTTQHNRALLKTSPTVCETSRTL